MAAVREGSVLAGSHRLYYYEVQGGKDLVLLIHGSGSGASGEDYLGLLQEASQCGVPLRIVAVDCPGYGRSEGSRQEIRSAPAATITSMIKALGHRKARCLMGTSQGGCAVLMAALEVRGISDTLLLDRIVFPLAKLSALAACPTPAHIIYDASDAGHPVGPKLHRAFPRSTLSAYDGGREPCWWADNIINLVLTTANRAKGCRTLSCAPPTEAKVNEVTEVKENTEVKESTEVDERTEVKEEPVNAKDDDESPESLWTCPLCSDVAVDPVRASPCRHIFCRFCISRALEYARACPICRGVVKTCDPAEDIAEMVRGAFSADQLKVREAEIESLRSRPRLRVQYGSAPTNRTAGEVRLFVKTLGLENIDGKHREEDSIRMVEYNLDPDTPGFVVKVRNRPFEITRVRHKDTPITVTVHFDKKLCVPPYTAHLTLRPRSADTRGFSIDMPDAPSLHP